MKKQQTKSVMRQYKMDLSRIGKYILILVPIAFIESFLISLANMKIWINVIIVVPTLLVWCVLFEVIYLAYKKYKEKKEKEQPAKEDIYAD